MTMLTAPLRAIGRMFEPRATLTNDGWWQSMMSSWGYGPSKAGIQVTPSNAMSASAVFGCIRAIAEDIGSLPFKVYTRTSDGGKDEARKHPLWPLLHDGPNDEMTAMDFRGAVTGQALLYGNGYAEIQWLRNGRPGQLWPLESSKVKPARDKADKLVYVQKNPGGQDVTLKAADVLHVRGFSSNGILGHMVTSLGKESIAVTLAAEAFGAAFFGNSARSAGVLETANQIKPADAENLRTQWEAQYGGTDNTGRTAILPTGMTYRPMTIQPDEAQFLETRQFQIEEVARWFRVPPHKIQHLLRSTFSNIEHQSIEYVVDAIRPWAKRWEQECTRKLFDARNSTYFCEHVLEDLLRGDSAARSTFYREAVNSGWMTRNEVRSRENMNRRPELDEPLVQGAMMAASALETKPKSEIDAEKVKNAPPPPPQLLPPGEPPPPPADDDDQDRARSVAVAGIVEAYKEPLGNAIRGKLKVAAAIIAENAANPDKLVAFYDRHAEHVRQAIKPVLTSAARALWAIRCARPMPTLVSEGVDRLIEEAAARNVQLCRDAVWHDDRPTEEAYDHLDHLVVLLTEIDDGDPE